MALHKDHAQANAAFFTEPKYKWVSRANLLDGWRQ
jgi:hypothetical protein